MVTKAERIEKYRGFGNEKLKPLAIGGDDEAKAELLRRGNVLTPEGKLRKQVRKEYTDSRGVEHVDEMVVEDGKMVERNGIPTTGNVVPF